MSDIKLYGRIFITGKIKAITGLHIGGSEGAISIGGVDNTVIRDPLTQQPYIPGSSLKGKMRSLLEKNDGRPQNRKIGQATIHTCDAKDEYDKCDVCQIYGVPGEADFSWPTRLVVRDVPLDGASIEKLALAKTDLPFTEVKWEVAIDRVTSAAVPRQMERVPAGAEFGAFEFVFSLYDPDDQSRFVRVVDSMSLLEDDYLGGSGSRGSGKIQFSEMNVSLKRSSDYLNPQSLLQKADLTGLTSALPTIQEALGKLFNE
ncbi:MAG: type III-A CRISPR-associated RAMP protein Csm3 [Ardenticatenaceae bacterium]|nr:type III-A CRISPR-associated RAMP protein Csm3 [Ardenticatenaceae bacterium]